MFENIIGQQAAVSSLKKAITSGNFPPAVIFHGPAFCGKLSTALEIARILCCEKKMAWNCTCHSCQRQRVLMHSNLLLLGARNFIPEITAAADVLTRTGKLFARYLFIRAVKKQLKAFDPILWEGEETKVKKHQQTILKVEEELNRLLPGFPLPEAKQLKALLAGTIKLCTQLAAGFKTENIPINQIRRAIFWAHHSSSEGKKIIIIEKADKMMDSSRNSLLKILEEPPENLYIILMTSHKGAILRTILSRVRPYLFRERTPAESKLILEKIFREASGEFNSVQEYFSAWKELNPSTLKALAHKFIQLVLARDNRNINILEEMQELVKAEVPREAVLSFFGELYALFSHILQHSTDKIKNKIGSLLQLENWSKILADSIYNLEHLNISPGNVLETVFYKFSTPL